MTPTTWGSSLRIFKWSEQNEVYRMKRNCFDILVLCLSIFLSGCNTIKESTTQSGSSSITTESTESSESGGTSATSEDTTSSSLSDTEPSVTYDSR